MVLIRTAAILAVASIFVALAADTPAQTSPEELTAAVAPPVAKIGDQEVVTREEYERALSAFVQARMAGLRQRGADPANIAQMAELSHEQKLRLVDSLVENRILYLLAKEAGITVTDDEVNAAIEENKAKLPSGTDYEDFIQQRGLTEAQVFENTKRKLMMKRFEEMKTQDVTVTDGDIKLQFEKLKDRGLTDEYDVQHILVKCPTADEDAVAEAKKKIDAALERIKKGEDFGKVAEEVSEDPGSKNNRGEYKNVRRGRMVPEFEQQMVSTKTGEVSEPFRTQYGWHILRVNRHETDTLTPELSENIGKQMVMARKKLAVKKLIDEARSKMSITINLPPEASSPGSPALPEHPAQKPEGQSTPDQSLLDAAT